MLYLGSMADLVQFADADHEVPEAGKLLAGRYRIGAELGRGGFARVYEAHDRVLDRPVAIKVLHPGDGGSDGVGDLLREARAAARVDHPGFVRIYDVVRLHRSAGVFIAMELVRGASLARQLRERGKLPLPEVLALARQILEALDAAHRAGVLHLDIKPGNILLAPRGRVKIADFGVARLRDRLGPPERRQPMGTPAYVAPEQLRGEPVDGRADLFSAAVVLYELLVGSKPFRAASARDTLAAVLVEPPAPMHGMSAQVEAVIRRGLAKRPGDRYVTGAALLADLERAARVAPRPIDPRIETDRRGDPIEGRRPDWQGAETQAGVHDLLLRLRRRRFQGLLVARATAWEMTVALVGGTPVGVRGGPSDTELGPLLLREGYLPEAGRTRVATEQQRATAWGAAEPFGAVAVRLGALDEAQLATALATQTDERLDALLALEQVDLWLYEGKVDGSRVTGGPRPIERIVADGLLGSAVRLKRVVDGAVASVAEQCVEVRTDAPSVLLACGLLTLGQPILDGAAGRTVAELVARGGQFPEVGRAIVYLLWKLGGIVCGGDVTPTEPALGAATPDGTSPRSRGSLGGLECRRTLVS